LDLFRNKKIIPDDPKFVYCTPGVNLQSTGDEKGQNYKTPAHVITKNGSDVIIVGRGIIGASDPLAAARKYREEGWKAYLQRLGVAKL